MAEDGGGLPSADYGHPTHFCDVVMKGGITSGVVYPQAICELARDYRFKSVGGTSAGAIAAAATAAAEYGREKGGFERLADLPTELGEDQRLLRLFQPEPSTRRVFAVLIGALEGGPAGVVKAALKGNALTAIVGGAPGIALIVLAGLHWHDQGFDALTVLAIVVGFLAFVLGVVGAVGARLARVLLREVPDNGFGICSGARADRHEEPGLTSWLAGLLDECAGLREEGADEGEGPLTFGHLWAGPDRDPDQPRKEGTRFVELQMMTTNLVNRTGKRIPWEAGGWYFDPVEFRRLFPEDVVDWMEAHPPSLKLTKEGRSSELHRAMMLPRLPLPEAKDLPVVVAARMSLSFPVLLSAVPLWSFDFSRPTTAALAKEWNGWLERRVGGGRGWRAPWGRPETWDYRAMPEALEPEVCWFSDGGISSNFPIHFFDRLVPDRPTFGINLRPFPLEKKPDPDDQAKNVDMVTDNGAGLSQWWYRLPERPETGWFGDTRLPSFLGAAVKTMQNRVDEAQMRAPGYRDRIAHVELDKVEGGMNLNMSGELIEELAERGRDAAGLLRRAYTDGYDSGRIITWDNHRWVRLRSAMAVLEQMHIEFTEGINGGNDGAEGGRTYQELIWRPDDDAPKSYKLKSNPRRERAEYEVDRICDLGSGPRIEWMMNGAPRPTPEGRITPKE
jgi:predicted acylesterase/phospholipase RssA